MKPQLRLTLHLCISVLCMQAQRNRSTETSILPQHGSIAVSEYTICQILLDYLHVRK